MKKFKYKKSYYRVFSIFISFIMILISVSVASLNASASDGDLDGLFLLNNFKYRDKYIHINNNNSMMDEGETIELHQYNPYWALRWYIISLNNGYYKIESIYSDKVLTAPTGYNNDIVTQTTYTGLNTQQWKFIRQQDGTYKISPRSNSNYFLTAGALSSTADQDLEIRTSQTDGGDKWILRPSALSYWNSNKPSIWSWATFPTLYYELLEANSAFYFYPGVSIARSQWEEALDINILSAAESQADIKFYGASKSYFAREGLIYIDLYGIGETISAPSTESAINYTWNGSTKTHYHLDQSTIYLSYQRPHDYAEGSLSYYEQYRSAVHELGHALGYNGHSPSSTDIMYAYNNESNTNYTLTTNDIAHLKQVYN